MASSSSVRLANMFPISFSTSTGCSALLRELVFGVLLVLGVGDGCGGSPGLGFGDENSAWRPAVPALVRIVPAFSLAKGRESDSVLELDLKLASDPFRCCNASVLINSCSSAPQLCDEFSFPGGVPGAGGGGKGKSPPLSNDILKLSELGYAGNGNGLDVWTWWISTVVVSSDPHSLSLLLGGFGGIFFPIIGLPYCA